MTDTDSVAAKFSHEDRCPVFRDGKFHFCVDHINEAEAHEATIRKECAEMVRECIGDIKDYGVYRADLLELADRMERGPTTEPHPDTSKASPTRTQTA